jgi:hypothetical protein
LDGETGCPKMIKRLIPWAFFFAYILIFVTIGAQFF